MRKSTILERIQMVQPYFKGVEIKENLYIIRVAFPDRWVVYPSEDGKIKHAASEAIANEWFYYASTSDVDLNDLFDLIEDTIKANEDMSKKIELMRVKMEELKGLFQEKTLEELETLQFTFGILKPKKRKYTRKINKVVQEEIEPSIDEVEEQKED